MCGGDYDEDYDCSSGKKKVRNASDSSLVRSLPELKYTHLSQQPFEECTKSNFEWDRMTGPETDSKWCVNI